MAFLESVWAFLGVLLKLFVQLIAVLLTRLGALLIFVVGLIVFLIGIVRTAGKRSAAGRFIKVGLIIMAVSVLLWFLGGLI